MNEQNSAQTPPSEDLSNIENEVLLASVGSAAIKFHLKMSNHANFKGRIMQSFAEALEHYESAINSRGEEDECGECYTEDDLLYIKRAIADAILAMLGFPLHLPEKPSLVKVKLKKTGPGFLYVMKNMRSNYVKIGWSTKPEFRETTLQSQEPEIELMGMWEAPRSIEKVLHARFQRHHMRGEWFDISPDDVRQIFEGKADQGAAIPAASSNGEDL